MRYMRYYYKVSYYYNTKLFLILIMNILGVNDVQRCPLEGTEPMTSYCIPTGRIFAKIF